VPCVRQHPLWRPYHRPSDEEIAKARVVEVGPERVEMRDPDPRWPDEFGRLEMRIRDALGELVLSLEHIGSTSVPGLCAKPVIDADLTVPDSADEAAYVPAMEAVGFVLRGREPAWEEHRMFRGADPTSNVHVWSPWAVEPRRTRMFRDWLRTHEGDRAAYAELKRSLAARGFTDVMHYNNAKGGLVYDIYERIFAADPEHEHDPHPRT
jgi:GrpB-like predicted nucleotidyltransferase (UPF0157 family)